MLRWTYFKEQPVVRDGQIVARAMMTITLSADHRITDGAEGTFVRSCHNAELTSGRLRHAWGSTAMLAGQEHFVTDAKGRKTAVLLPIRAYQRRLEDLRDLAIAAVRQDEEPLSLGEMKRRLT